MVARYWKSVRSELGRRVVAAQLTEDHFGPCHPAIPDEGTVGDDRAVMKGHDQGPRCPDEHYEAPRGRRRYCPSCERDRCNARRRASRRGVR